MKKIFITSIGTEIGKTFITCALTNLLKTKNRSVHTIKPVISGFDFSKTPNDISEICESLNLEYGKKNISEVARYIYKNPLSPDMAGRLEKNKIKIPEIQKFIKKFDNEYLLIEGIGGALVPLNKKEITTHLIKKTADKTILVTGSFLGSLSYTISTLKALELEKIKPDLIIATQKLNKDSENYIDINNTIKSLENFTRIPILKLENVKNNSFKTASKMLDKAGILKYLK